MAKKPTHAVALDPAMRLVVLYGKERFLIEEHTRRFAESLEQKFGGLETFVFDGETVEPAKVLDELRSYGLMQRHKLVIVDNAETFLAGGRSAAAEDEDGSIGEEDSKSTRRPLMERYAENPVEDATLLMRATTWRAGKLDKLIAKVGSINECKALDDRMAASWCAKRVEKRYDARIEPDAAELLVARLGPELQHLDTELAKLGAMAVGGAAGGADKVITRAMVAQAVGLSREEKAWEIQSAVITGNAAAMLGKLRELLEISRQDVVPISWAICELLKKLHTAARLLGRGVPRGGVVSQMRLWGSSVEPILQIAGGTPPAALAQLLRQAIETDMKTKTGVGDPQRCLETLMVKIADTLRTEVRSQKSEVSHQPV